MNNTTKLKYSNKKNIRDKKEICESCHKKLPCNCIKIKSSNSLFTEFSIASPTLVNYIDNVNYAESLDNINYAIDLINKIYNRDNKTIKYKRWCFRGRTPEINKKIFELLDPMYNHSKNITKLKNDIDRYKATPKILEIKNKEKKYVVYRNYEKFLKKIKQYNIKGNICIKYPNMCQFHGGDLFAHSQWTALQVLRWNQENLIYILVNLYNNYNESKVVDQHNKLLDINLLAIAGFFHDIGKGGDCFYNIYSSKKYNGKGSNTHPKWCGDIILGIKKYKICNGDKISIFNIKKLLEKHFEFSKYEIFLIAISSYMHWELGRLNLHLSRFLDKSNNSNSVINNEIDKYLIKFYKYCKLANLHLFNSSLYKDHIISYTLIASIIIAGADITASTNRRLPTKLFEPTTFKDFLLFNESYEPSDFRVMIKDNGKEKGINIVKQKYPTDNAWEKFYMNILFLPLVHLIFYRHIKIHASHLYDLN